MTKLDEHSVAAYWDENAASWITQIRAGGDRIRELFINPSFLGDFLPNIANKKVIDIGCGEGYSARLLASLGASVVGVDISARLVDAARRAEASHPLGIVYENCSFAELHGFSNQEFDVAVSMMAFMDSPRLQDAVRAVARVLKSGGRLHFSILHPCFWTPGSTWIADDRGEMTGIIGNYWGEPYIEVDRFFFSSNNNDVGFSIPRFPYRLEEYVNALSAAGFVITSISEPRPTKELLERHPELPKTLRQAPLSLYVSALKP